VRNLSITDVLVRLILQFDTTCSPVCIVNNEVHRSCSPRLSSSWEHLHCRSAGYDDQRPSDGACSAECFKGIGVLGDFLCKAACGEPEIRCTVKYVGNGSVDGSKFVSHSSQRRLRFLRYDILIVILVTVSIAAFLATIIYVPLTVRASA